MRFPLLEGGTLMDLGDQLYEGATANFTFPEFDPVVAGSSWRQLPSNIPRSRILQGSVEDSLPASTWRKALLAEDVSFRFVNFVMSQLVMVDGAVGLFFLYNDHFPYANVVSLCFLITFAVRAIIFYGGLIGRWQLFKMFDKAMDARLTKPTRSGFKHALWWVSGALRQPSFFVPVFVVINLVQLQFFNNLTQGRVPLKILMSITALLPGAFNGGRPFLSAIGLLLLTTFVIPTCDEQVVVAQEFLDSHPRSFRTIILIVEITTMCLVVKLGHLVFTRVAQIDSNTAQLASMLLRDVRTPLHGLLGAATELQEAALSQDEDSHVKRSDSDVDTVGAERSVAVVRQRSLALMDSKLESPAETILGCALTMRSMLNNVVARLHTKSTIRIDPLSTTTHKVDLGKFFHRCDLLLKSSARRKAQSATLAFLDSRPGSPVTGFPVIVFPHAAANSSGDLMQAFVNLASNAHKFAPVRGSISVQLSLVPMVNARPPVLGEPAKFVVEVEDSGPGIAPHLRQKVFREYNRGGSLEEGIGLGLAVVQECLDRLGGTVVCSEGRTLGGALFRVELPCEVVQDGGRKIHRTGSTLGASPKKIFGPELRQAVIVDDNFLNRRILERMFRSHGVENLLIFGSAEECISHLETSNETFQVAVLDFVLPGKNGMELTAEIVRRYSEQDEVCVIIGASATATDEVTRRWRDAGANFFIPKPFSLRKFEQVMEAASKMLCELTASQHQQVLTSSSEGSDFSEFSGGDFPSLVVGEDGETTLLSRPMDEYLLEKTMNCLAFTMFVFSVSLLVVSYRDYWTMAVFLIICSIFNQVLVNLVQDGSTFFGRPLKDVVAPYMTFTVFLGSLIYNCDSRSAFSVPLLFSATLGSTLHRLSAVCLALVSFTYILAVPAQSLNMCVSMFPHTTGLLSFDSVVIMSVFMVVLVQLSVSATVSRRRSRWSHTLSHDVRSPLHGLFSATSELEESITLSASVATSLATVRACAQELLYTVDVSLSLARLDSDRQGAQFISYTDMAQLLDTQFSMLVDPKFLRNIQLNNPTSKEGAELPRSDLFFALVKFCTFVTLYRRPYEVVQVALLVRDGDDAQIEATVSGSPSRGSLRGRRKVNEDASPELMQHMPAVSGVFGEILQRLHGRIEFTMAVESDPWRLKLIVPVTSREPGRSRRSSVSPVAPAQRELTASAAAKLLGNIDAFIVDDDMVSCRILTRMLSTIGVESVQFSDSREGALRLFTELEPKVRRSLESRRESPRPVFLLLDLTMPGIDGIDSWVEMIGGLMTLPNVVTIACSGRDEPHIAKRCVSLGIQLLVKPFGKPDLKRALEAGVASFASRA